MPEAQPNKISQPKEALKNHPELWDLLCVLSDFQGIVKGTEDGNDWVGFVSPNRNKSILFVKNPNGYSMKIVEDVVSGEQ